MPREIKFRVKTSSGWYYWKLESSFQPMDVAVAEGMPDWKTVGEFTGLHDKDGKEIYEGDIVRMNAPEGYDPTVNVVEFEVGSFILRVFGCDEVSPFWLIDATPWAEVIGNIYENPDVFTDSYESLEKESIQ